VRPGSCHYKPIGGVTMESRGQTIDRYHDLTIEG
jgi:hypothetical protein